MAADSGVEMGAEMAAEASGGLEIHPMEQFEIKRLIPMNIGDFDFSFTNSSLFMVIAVLGISALMLMGSRSRTTSLSCA